MLIFINLSVCNYYKIVTEFSEETIINHLMNPILMQDQIYKLLTDKDEVTWKSIIYDLIKAEELDPWNINVSHLSKRYIEAVQKLQEHNFFISGKVLLASSILLRMKSHKLVNEHIAEFDTMLFPPEEDLLEDMEDDIKNQARREYPDLLIKTPQPRKRQLTIKDLMLALEKAIEVDEKRKIKRIMSARVIREAVLPDKKIDITQLIQSVYERIKSWFSKKPDLTFTELVGSDKKEDKILTFIPLLYLSNQQKIDLQQEKPFSEIHIKPLE
jgi:segregation and condensation protein A